MRFLDQSLLLEVILGETPSSQLTFQTVNESVLSFSMQLPLYLNTPQLKTSQAASSQISELELIRSIIHD